MSSKTVLLLGLTGVVVDDAQKRLADDGFRLVGGQSVEDLRTALAVGPVDHVVMGAGIDLDTRLAIIREIFESSDTTTVHLKDRASGKEAFAPFVDAVLHGLRSYDP